MTDEKKNNTLISDSGVIIDNKTKQARLFIGLCHTVTLVLAILGFLALYVEIF